MHLDALAAAAGVQVVLRVVLLGEQSMARLLGFMVAAAVVAEDNEHFVRAVEFQFMRLVLLEQALLAQCASFGPETLELTHLLVQEVHK